MVSRQNDSMAMSDLRRVQRCAHKLEETRQDLKDAIRQAHQSGETYRDIARYAGMSHQRIAQIVNE